MNTKNALTRATRRFIQVDKERTTRSLLIMFPLVWVQIFGTSDFSYPFLTQTLPNMGVILLIFLITFYAVWSHIQKISRDDTLSLIFNNAPLSLLTASIREEVNFRWIYPMYSAVILVVVYSAFWNSSATPSHVTVETLILPSLLAWNIAWASGHRREWYLENIIDLLVGLYFIFVTVMFGLWLAIVSHIIFNLSGPTACRIFIPQKK